MSTPTIVRRGHAFPLVQWDILRTLAASDEPLSGSDIGRRTQRQTHRAGAIYADLKLLTEAGFLTVEGKPGSRRLYRITDAGREELSALRTLLGV